MQANSGSSININSAFSCKLCRKLVLQPLQNQCCTIIICDTCVGTNCYHCKKACNYKKSPFLQHLYKNITIKCPFKCQAELTLFMLKQHIASCPQATMECTFCKDKNIKAALFPQHMGQKHQQECSRLLIEFHRQKDQAKMPVFEKKILNPFALGMSKICKNGRIVCGGELGIQNGSGFFKSGNKVFCSLQAGSCSKCMKKDKQRLGLPQNCLLNFEGRICYFSAPKKRLGCGIGCGSNGNPFICNAQYSCRACLATVQLINKGLYSQLLNLAVN